MKTRTPEEISRWLKKRLWYIKFVNNLFNQDYELGHPEKILSGKYLEQTISSAFTYSETPEGIAYWGRKEYQFLRWYYHQGFEIFRCKWFTIQI